jgi:glutaredoxin
VKPFLDTKGVHFTNQDISQNENAQELEARTGNAGTVPVIVVGTDVIVGFDRATGPTSRRLLVCPENRALEERVAEARPSRDINSAATDWPLTRPT